MELPAQGWPLGAGSISKFILHFENEWLKYFRKDITLAAMNILDNSDELRESGMQQPILFRAILSVGVIGTVAVHFGANIQNPLVFTISLVALIYLVASIWILFSFKKLEKMDTGCHFLGHVDALLMGVFICLLDFSPTTRLCFILVIQVQALAGGSLKLFLADNLALLLGIVSVTLFQQPDLMLTTAWTTDLAAALTLGTYAAARAGLARIDQARMLAAISELENQKVELKLSNYKLSKYLSPALRKAILSGKTVKLGTQRKKVTVFFSDIVGFSELAEETEADTLTELLNSYLTEMSDIALKFGGTIDKFIGDAIMVFFGDPVSRGAHEDSLACVSMAIAMQKRMKELLLRWKNQGIVNPLQVRMGINTGFCTVGNFGTEDRLDYTLLGTEVNLASRLESSAEPGEILISHTTYSLVKDTVKCNDKGTVTVKGFHTPVQVYSVVDLRKNLGKNNNYFELNTEGFSMYLDMEKIRNYDQKKIVESLANAYTHLKRKNLLK